MTWSRGGAPRHAMIDTAAFYALTDIAESRHQHALTIHRRLVSERWQLFTTNLIVAEAHGLLLGRLGRRPALRFLDSLDRSPTTIVRVEPEDEARARRILHQYADKDFSLTDAASFAVMERLRIPYAFTFDRNFIQYGLAVLTPGQRQSSSTTT